MELESASECKVFGLLRRPEFHQAVATVQVGRKLCSVTQG